MLEAEQSVLGSCLLETSAVDEALVKIGPDDFASEKHRLIFQAMVDLVAEKKPVEFVTVSAHLERLGKLETAGGASYLMQLTDIVPTPSLVGHYAEEVREFALTRRIAEVGEMLKVKARQGEKPRDLLRLAEEEIFRLGENRQSSTVHIKTAVRESFHAMEQASLNQGQITGIKTGITKLDWLLCGLNKSKLYILAARPGMGKTALAMNIIENAGIHAGVPTLLFSMEMSRSELATRGICSYGRIDSAQAKIGMFSDADHGRLQNAMNAFHKAPIFINDSVGLSVTEIRSEARRAKRRHGIGLVVVDYIQLAEAEAKTREQEVSKISRGLKWLAKELDVPVVALSQLNRSLENRTDKRPIMADLRDSGALEQDADVIMFLYREAAYCPDCKRKQCTKQHANDAEIIVAKHRDGSTGTVLAKWHGSHTRFDNAERP